MTFREAFKIFSKIIDANIGITKLRQAAAHTLKFLAYIKVFSK